MTCIDEITDISEIEDVKRFFHYLYDERKVLFHPDDKFELYVKFGEDTPTFTPSECEKFDGFMDQCFKFCEANGISIYDLASEIRDNI